MTLSLADLALLGVLFLVEPFYGLRTTRRLRAAVERGVASARRKQYLWTIALEWVLAAAALLVWTLGGRGLADLGLGMSGGAGWWWGLALGLAVCAALTVQTIVVLRSPEKMREVRRSTESMRSLLPQDDREEAAFAALSVTAGVCEEILYRGFALAVLTPLLGVVGAVIVSSVGFGLGHIYQGPGGFAKTTVIGLAMAGLTVLTGSLWVPMIVHAVLDLNAGYMLRRCLAAADGPAPGGATGAACC